MALALGEDSISVCFDYAAEPLPGSCLLSREVKANPVQKELRAGMCLLRGQVRREGQAPLGTLLLTLVLLESAAQGGTMAFVLKASALGWMASDAHIYFSPATWKPVARCWQSLAGVPGFTFLPACICFESFLRSV